jgi:hypothetical protein
MKSITIRSTFHPALAVTLRPGPDGELSARQIARLKRGLCGMTDCACGGLTRSTIDEGGRIELYLNPDWKATSGWYIATDEEEPSC